jgi:acetyl-CoA carboxylase biotin carboxyl carrier protein
VNLKELKEVFRLVEKTDFTEVEIVQDDFRIRIERGKGGQALPYITSPILQSEPTPIQMGSLEISEPVIHPEPRVSSKPSEKKEVGMFVTSPFVGTFYRFPSPDAEAFVEVGQVVKKGQVLCIVEAMKLMNEIESEYDGKISEIYVQNAQPVEFAQRLFRIEPV